MLWINLLKARVYFFFIMTDKKTLRNRIKGLKKEVSEEIKLTESKRIFEKVEALTGFSEAKTILAYWSLPDEVYTHEFVLRWHKEKAIVLPIVVGKTLELRLFTGMDCMVREPVFGIMEPKKGKLVDSTSLQFGIIPGVAFDPSGNRLGRGKAFYDQLLMNTSFLKVGVCFSFQMVEIVPTDRFDIPMDRIIHG